MYKWGIIGAGQIARRFIKSLMNHTDGQLYAVASLTKEKQEAFRNEFPHIQVYSDYESLIHDKNIDVIYIAIRHKDHYQWAKEALLNKKAVLCEKPATLSLKETAELCEIAKANHTFFMEAMKTRFIPLVQEIKELLNQGIIGDIQKIETYFCYERDYLAGHYLFDKDQGGILNDVSSYNIASILDYIQSPIKLITCETEYLYGVDAHDKIHITFENHQEASLEIAFNVKKEPQMVIQGTLGKLTAQPFYRPESAQVYLLEKPPYTIEKPYLHDDFYSEIQEVHDCLKAGRIESQRMSFDDSIKVIEIIEKIRNVINKE